MNESTSKQNLAAVKNHDTNKVSNSEDTMQNNIKDTADDIANEVAKGGSDWFEYIKTHPLQSICFGVTALLAFKGAIS